MESVSLTYYHSPSKIFRTGTWDVKTMYELGRAAQMVEKVTFLQN